MDLTFKHARLAELLEKAKPQWEKEVRATYGQENPLPGFWLVGDQGVYLMHNGKAHEIGVTQPLVYAEECNPDTMEFDAWWAVKRATFGADDGVEYIERAHIEEAIRTGSDLVISFSPEHMSIGFLLPKDQKPPQGRRH